MADKRLYTVSEAARLLDVHEQTIYLWLREAKIKSVDSVRTASGRYLFTREALIDAPRPATAGRKASKS
jgi:excisionase family DNA binding protein